LAAALVLGLIGWAWHFGVSPSSKLSSVVAQPNPPLLATLLQRDLRLARAGSARERVEVLASLADDLHHETRTAAAAAGGEEVGTLARLYEQIITEGILKQARALPASDRSVVLDPIAARLAESAADVEQLLHDVPAEYAAPLNGMAGAARAGNRKLADLVKGERS
jgi:hypothetical protein